MSGYRAARVRPRVVHLTTSDISLSLLLGPQLRAFAGRMGVAAKARE